MRAIGFALLALLCLSVATGQSIPFIGVKGHYGKILPHSPELKPLSNTNPFGLEFDVSWMKTSDEAWKTCNCYGRTGISFSYFNYNNPTQLGNSYNLSYFAEPYLTYKGRFKLSLRSAVGVSYLDQVYNAESNPENLFYSTPISFYLLLGLNYNYHMSDRYAINASINYNHISNGGMRQPNKGINFPTISFGIDRVINFQELQPKPDELKKYDPSVQFYLNLFSSLRSADETEESSNHLRIGVLGGIIKPLSSISGLTAGFEVSVDGSYQQIINEEGLDESPIVSAILAGHRFKFGNISFFTQFGAYTTRPQSIQTEWLFQNYMLWYQFGDRFGIGTALIAYGKVADHMDFRLVYYP